MTFDFPTILTLATLLTGTIWAFDSWLLAPKRRAAVTTLEESGAPEPERLKAGREPLVVEYAKSFFPVILVVLLLRSFLVEPFRIPSDSMMPTLLHGDFILVNKFSYGIRLPVINRKVIGLGDPERGDVVVFRYPRDPSQDYIKRVVGLPGDHIAYYGKTLYINGEPMPQEPVGTYEHDGAGHRMNGARELQEELAGVEHRILIRPGAFGVEGQVVVPEGHYFVMGDNRDNSNDSRVWGFVPDENLVGKAFMVWMNWDPVYSSPIWGRIGNGIH